MRNHLLILIALLGVPLAAHATITEVQHPVTSSTQCGTFGGTTTTTCTLPVTATGTGHFGIVTVAVLSKGGSPTHVTSITDNKGGTWLQPSGCYFSDTSDRVGTIACAYNLTLAAGVTAITANWDILTNEGARLDFREYSYSGASVALDNTGQLLNVSTGIVNPIVWAKPSGLTGTNDVIVQAIGSGSGTQAGVTTYGNLNATSFYGSADLLNTTSTTAPTSTSSAPSSYVMAWIAIRESQSGQESSATSILTQHYDTARTGQNTTETVLTPANVNSTLFGKLFSLTVDGYVYAQPLYVPALAIPGNGTHNVLYVATEHDSLYAFDADTGSKLWMVSFLINGATTLSPSDVGDTQDINPEIGITGTPTIDNTTNTIYVVVNTKESGNNIYRLHAMDITTGAEKFGGPALMTASAPGTAPDGNGSTVPFNGQWENQRPGLLLLNGFVYIGFAAHGDNGPWHGWILAYNKTTLAQSGVWCTSPNGKGNGIWASGSGLAADSAGSIYIATGNGDDTVTTPAPPPSTTIDYGDSIVRVGLTNGVPVPTDYFTPWNQASLSGSDTDLGSGGVLVLPDQPGTFTHILIQSGKQGEVYVVNRDKMTSDGSHYCNGCTSDPEIIQSISSGAGLWSMPAYWNSQIYLWGNGGSLEAYSLTNGKLSLSPTSTSAESNGFPGATPVVSSNGTSNGLVWAVETDAYTSSGPAILRAYNATNVSDLRYASNLTSGRDTLGPAVKFVVPVVTNGKVYVGAQKEVDVFGLLSGESQAVAPAFSPAGGSYSTGTKVTITSTTPGASIYYTTDGSAPSGGSNLYSGPLTVSDTTTFNAVAISTGFVQSVVSTATYTIQDQTAPPDVSPAAGTYSSAQSVQLSDTSPTPTIYYTTNGTMPTHSSAKYTVPISVTSTTTITAIASSPGLNDSPAVTATFTINPSAATINFGVGFSTPTGIQFNGSTDLDDSRLQLTNGAANEAGSAFFTTPMNITSFTTDFTFQLSDAMADGITFTIQNSSAGAKALGPTGGGLGYGPDSIGGTGGISNSVAVKYDLYNNNGEGEDSTGLYTNGASPTTPATDMTSSGVILNNGDTMTVHITYNGTTLAMTITDSTVNATFSTSWPINIPQTIGGNTAFVGFTGGTGGETASQKIETWTFASTPGSTQVQTPIFNPGAETFHGTATVSITDVTTGSSIYYTTDGSAPVPGAGTTKQYTTALSLSATTTVNAIATASGDTNSATGTATYTLQAAATPAFSPAAGTILTTQGITISDATSGAAIYYTTNGTTPTASSTLYSGPVTIAATTTFKAIAISTGYLPSAVATATYTITPAAVPTVSPAAGTYSSAQSVKLSDTSPTPTIYYTTDGTKPTHSSKQYTTAISVTSTTTISAIASSPGLGDSPVLTATFTIASTTTPINFPSGFTTATGFQFNGSAKLVSSQLQLTDGGSGEAGSVFFTTPVNVSNFTTNFTFQLASAQADGFTFTIQNSSAGATALSTFGGGLGYGPYTLTGTPGISNSVAVKYDLYSNNGEGTDSTGLYTDGASPTTPATDMTSSGVILSSGDLMAVQITYNGTTLTMTITDSTANKSFTTSWPVNIPQTIGGSTAYVGFTGGTGGLTATQSIKTWTFASN
jgi:Legume lectin domain/Chitobiase/beta-hexosaminidase C-terminal domain/Fn3 associated